MRVINVYNSKQKLIELSDGSRWYINGIPDQVKKMIGFAKGPARFNSNINIYYHDRIDNSLDEHPHQTILDDIRDVKQPSEKSVRSAMIWSLRNPNEKYHYAIKSGGESSADHEYESDYCPTIIGSNGNDKRILLIKRFSSKFKDVLIYKELVEELYEACESKNQVTKRKKSDSESAIHCCFGATRKLHISNKTGIKGAQNWTKEQVFDSCFSDQYDSVYVVDMIEAKIDRLNAGLDRNFGKEREMRVIFQNIDGKSEAEMMEQSVKHYHNKLFEISIYEWMKQRFLSRRREEHVEERQLALFAD